MKQLPRIIGGLALGLLLYYGATRYATVDCQTLQFTIRAGGIASAGKIVLALVLILLTGTSTAVVGLLAGLLAGPLVGAPLASLAVFLSSAICWFAGRQLGQNSLIPQFIIKMLDSSSWFQGALDRRSASGFRWTAMQSMNAPVNFAFFSFFIGAKVPHLNLSSLASGIFAGSVLYVAGYSLAGASIGCAVVNHALDLPFEQYRTMMAVSCLTLLLLSRLQALTKTRSEP